MIKILFFCVLLIAAPAYAESTYGLSMHGVPKYTAADTHLGYANPDAPKGGTLRQAAIGTFDTLNPYTIKGKAAQGLNLITDRLMARVWNEPFTLYPLIAEKVDVPEDRSSITFTLNLAARFHDGSPIAADDVLFSYETLKDMGRPNMRRIYKLALRAEKLDERTVKFTFGEGYDRETVMIFAMMPVLSKGYWKERDFDQTTLDPPLSSGPYKIAYVEAGRKIVYERVPDYWAKDLLTNVGHHNFDRISYDYYRDNTVSFEAFKAGDLTIRREWDAGDWYNAYTFPAVETGQVMKESLAHGRPDRVRAFIFNTRKAPFNDQRVRKALGLLFDFDAMNKALFHGAYKQINSFYPNTDLAAATSQEDSQPSLSKRDKLKQADRLLKEAGWVVRDGKRVNAQTGEDFMFELILGDPNQEKILPNFINQLKRMGISVQVRTMGQADFLARLTDYDFDMVLYYWHSTLSPGTEQYLYWSCEASKQSSRWNYAGVCDPEVDQLSQDIATTKTRTELIEKTRKLDQKLLDGDYMIPLYYNPNDFVAYWLPLIRPDVTPLYGMVLETWWMDQALEKAKD